MTVLNRWLIVAALIVLAGVSRPALGQCVIFEDPADRFRLADAVFLGTVRKTEPTGAVGFHIVMHRASFEIERVWKGQVKTFETVGTVEAFVPGRRSLVFASGFANSPSGVRERRLDTSLECGWTRVESEAGRDLQWLGQRVSRSPAR